MLTVLHDFTPDHSATLFPERSALSFEMIDVAGVIQTEELDVACAARLAQKILSAGHWTTPILLLSEAPVLLDGHHRLYAAKQLGLTHIPAYRVSIHDDRLTLGTWRGDEHITMPDVIENVMMGRLFPKKTTRFTVSVERPLKNIPLDVLRD